MARSKIRTTLDVSREQTPSVIIAKKLDINSRFFNAVILDSGRPLFIPQTSTAVLNAKRSDGEKQVFSCVINPNGTITAPLSPWLLELSGDCICDISIYGSDETKLTTVSFTVRVDGCVVEPEEIEEDADYTAVHDILLEATAALGSISELKTSVEAAEALRQQGYNQAAAAVNAAVQSANEAATAAENVNISVSQLPNGMEVTVTDRSGVEKTASIAVNAGSGGSLLATSDGNGNVILTVV